MNSFKPGISMKRKADDDPSSSSFNHTKVIKTEKLDSSPNYSQDVKKKISASARTGQACDRCRVRKMRCDDQQNGCAPCMQNNSECKTTDRITGKATVRGYVQSLERRLEVLENHNRELQTRLLSLGEDVKIGDGYADPAAVPLLQWHDDQQLRGPQGRQGSGPSLDTSDQGVNAFSRGVADGSSSSTATDEHPPRLPEFRDGLSGNNYLGVSTGNSLLSSIRGTSMNVLGMEIDLADYMSADLDEPDPAHAGTQPVYNKSYRAFVQTAFGMSPKLAKVELPPKSEGLNYAQVYFRVTNPYLPVLHKPSFMATLVRTYDDPSFNPSVAETVMVHAMFAIMYCQYAARAAHNAEHQAELNNSSNFHYHYALGHFAQLIASHTLADLQALTMLCLHIRNMPKPGACWMITSITLDLAIELGLHRSARRWARTSKRSILEIEMRKRVFWSLLVIHVIVAGNLGRPMPLRPDDWDVEMPKVIDDDLLSDDGISTSRPGKCNFLVGIEASKVMPMYMDLYNNIYAVKRSPHTYVDTVHMLERRIREWSEKWPAELKHESAAVDEIGQSHHHHLAIIPCHMRLLLRHPSLSLTMSPDFNSENLKICMEMSRKMLFHARQLQKIKCLDGTWQAGALYVLAISTTLFGHWERRDQITQNDLNALRDDMESWLIVIADMSNLLGSGKRLQDAVRVPVDRTLSLLSQHLESKTAPFPPPSNKHNVAPNRTLPSNHAPAPDGYLPSNTYPPYPPPADGPGNTTHQGSSRHLYLPPPKPNVPSQGPPSYQNTTQYPYHQPYANNTSTYDSGSYPSTNDLPTTAAAASAYLQHFPPQHPPPTQPYLNTNAPSYNTYHSPGSPTSWRNWAGNMASNLEPGADYMNSASALMQLGGRSEGGPPSDLQPGAAMHQGGGGGGGGPMDGNNGQQMWPFMNL